MGDLELVGLSPVPRKLVSSWREKYHKRTDHACGHQILLQRRTTQRIGDDTKQKTQKMKQFSQDG